MAPLSKEKHKKLWAIHSWVGLYAGLVICILSITGAAALFKNEIDRLLNKDMLVVQQQDKRVSLTVLTQQVQQQYPASELVSLEMPTAADEVYGFRLKQTGSDESEEKLWDVYANPYTGEITGSRDYYKSFAFFLRNLHVRLYEHYWGRQIVGLFGIALLVSTITGLLIYGGFMKKQLFGSIRQGRGIRIVAADWHKLVGVATLLFNLIISMTGAWLGLQPKIMKWTGMKAPNYYVAAAKPLAPEEDKQLTVDYDALLVKAQQVYPELLPLYITASADGSRQVQIFGNIPGTVYERRIQKLVLDKETQEVKYLYDARRQDLGDQLYNVQEALHFGDFGGLLLKIVYCLFGLTSGALSITGYIVYLKRKEKKIKPEAIPVKSQKSYAGNFS